MKKFNRLLGQYVRMEMGHCGHEGDAVHAYYKGEELKAFVRTSLDTLAKKAGEP